VHGEVGFRPSFAGAAPLSFDSVLKFGLVTPTNENLPSSLRLGAIGFTMMNPIAVVLLRLRPDRTIQSSLDLIGENELRLRKIHQSSDSKWFGEHRWRSRMARAQRVLPSFSPVHSDITGEDVTPVKHYPRWLRWKVWLFFHSPLWWDINVDQPTNFDPSNPCRTDSTLWFSFRIRTIKIRKKKVRSKWVKGGLNK
jgi:hypothetical protein